MNYQNTQLIGCDPEELRYTINQTDMEHWVLPGGSLNVEVDSLYLDNASLQRGRYGMAVQVKGAWPKGQVCVGLVLDAPDTATINGCLCPARSVQLYSEGSEISYRAPAGSTWLAFCAEREYFQQIAAELYGELLPIPATGMITVRPEETSGLQIAAAINGTLEIAGSMNQLPEIDQVMQTSEEAILREVLCAIHTDRRNVDRAESRSASRRRTLMSRAEDYLLASKSDPFDLRAFARSVGTSERMLEYHFKHIYGVTPLAWMRSMKLNAIRDELKRHRVGGERISDIALRWGFTHFGRFSSDYRQLFGESPRDTQTRCRRRAPVRHPDPICAKTGNQVGPRDK
ncbi:MAG: helix-turn-helix domain-containing protein [Halioglobus sp.]|nr:helix-turn-helix domain-containing protein [Halioglobus sp.]